jgi:hypothetical protein
MTFQQVITALRRARPTAHVGLTAQRGKYYGQAVSMSFTRETDTAYFAEGDRGKTMWLYVNDDLNRICCGNKG